MDDPLYTNRFIKQIIDARHNDIEGFVYVSKGNRMTIGKDKSKAAYLFSLLLIMGPFYFLSNSLITILHKIKIKLSPKISFISSPLVIDYAKGKKIKAFEIENPNSKESLNILSELNPDVIINQSQSIIGKELLKIPTIVVINRHNALLPKNRGRLTPFWVLYKGEKKTGVSIHFVEEGIDSGDIIVQEKYDVNRKDTFGSLVKKNYKIAPRAMQKALDKLEKGEKDFIPNNDELATYNTTPDLRHAVEYRIRRIKSFLKHLNSSIPIKI
jgi:methionyl-tRNA formyltransferase